MCKAINKALLLFITVSLMVLVGGCGIIEGTIKRANEEKALKQLALAYVEERYGGKAEVLDVIQETTTVGFRGATTSRGLVTVDYDGEHFDVFLDMNDATVAMDNRGGNRLAAAFDEYFRNLYHLPPAAESEVILRTESTYHFIDQSNCLDFPYNGEPLAEVMPLLSSVHFSYNYVDDDLTFREIAVHSKDWFESTDKLSIRMRCFREYNASAAIPLGIKMVENTPVLMINEIQFSYNDYYERYESFLEIADGYNGAQPSFAVREWLDYDGQSLTFDSYNLMEMDGVWVHCKSNLEPRDYLEVYRQQQDWTEPFNELFYGQTKHTSESADTNVRPYLSMQFEQAYPLVLRQRSEMPLPEGGRIQVLFPQLFSNPDVVALGETHVTTGEQSIELLSPIGESRTSANRFGLNSLSTLAVRFFGFSPPSVSELSYTLLQITEQ